MIDLLGIEKKSSSVKMREFKGTQTQLSVDRPSYRLRPKKRSAFVLSGNRMIATVFGRTQEEADANALVFSEAVNFLQETQKFVEELDGFIIGAEGRKIKDELKRIIKRALRVRKR